MTDDITEDHATTGASEIKPISIVEEMRRSYLDYAMSVIVSRALPDARDGLKPVHRRILYSMSENGYEWNKPHRKSARVVGDVIGKYHPHGDQAVYDAQVRMAQDFSMRLPLIDGQGNFGSVDGDPPAAMRYTEVRLEKIANFLLEDKDKDTVDYVDNYDNSEREPAVLPARFPNLLVNGAGGIAVGMATNIPPHNLGEVINAALALIDNPDLSAEDLMEIMPGPDFPTGGIILGRSGIRSAYTTGRGSIALRARTEIETLRKDREAIIVTELPYQVNKAVLIEKIAEHVREKRIEGITDIRDESDRQGMRIVIELRRDAVAEVVLNQLYRHTALQTSFGANMVALNLGKPELMGLKDLLAAFLAFREEVVRRRTRFLLNQARERAHIQIGLAIAVANIDEVIKVIRHAPNPANARAQLMERRWPASDVAPLVALVDERNHKVAEDGTYQLSETQTRSILELRLQRLTALGREEIAEEVEKLAGLIRRYLEILASRALIQNIVREEMVEVRDEFATPRLTELAESEADMEDEDLIQREEMVVTFSHAGYIKRVPLSTYRAQRRGGKGRSGMATRDEDVVTRLFVANTHTAILFFSSRGIVYKLKVWRLPLAPPQGRGKALVNLLPLEADERITSILPLPDDEDASADLDVVFATRSGNVRRNKLSDFTQVYRNGKIAMKLEDDDQIVDVQTATEASDILLTSATGQCIRFPVSSLRVFVGRNSTGVRGLALGAGDLVISMSILNGFEASPEERTAYVRHRNAERREAGEGSDEGTGPQVDLSDERISQMQAAEQYILTVSENGYGKRTSAYEYRVSGRGGKGVAAMGVNTRIGKVVASFPVEPHDDVMLVSNAGQLIRCMVEEINISGRATQGVTLFRTSSGQKVVSVAHISDAETEGDDPDEATDVALPDNASETEQL